MKNEQLLPRITNMSYEGLLAKIKGVREARIDARSASAAKATKKTKPKKAAVDKLVDGMSDNEKAKLIALLEGQK